MMESDPATAAEARTNGWKLIMGEVATSVPVYDKNSGEWFLLDNQYGRKIVKK
jgi:hypothetical protein